MKKLQLHNINIKYKLPSLKKIRRLKADITKTKIKINHQIRSSSSSSEDYHLKEKKLREKLLDILAKKQALPPEELLNLLSEIVSLERGKEENLEQEDINEKLKSIFKEISKENIKSNKS